MGPKNEFFLNCQVFKERCAESPGILVLGHGDQGPTPDKVAALERYNYYVISASVCREDNVSWLGNPRCIGALLHDPQVLAAVAARLPDLFFERLNCVTLNLWRTATQLSASMLSLTERPFTEALPSDLKCIDMSGCWTAVDLKRSPLWIETALQGDLSAYLVTQEFGARPELVKGIEAVAARYGQELIPFYAAFEQYAQFRVGEKVIIDGRPIGINNGIFSSVLDKTRVYVHTSETEGIPNSILEALLKEVPVLICEDVLGPLTQMAKEMPGAISTAAPSAASLQKAAKDIIANYEDYRAAARHHRHLVDPFEINRRLIRGAQSYFAKHNLPWKGQAFGLIGTGGSLINIAEEIPALTQATGYRNMYPNQDLAEKYLEYQLQVARDSGNTHAKSLLTKELTMVNSNNPWLQQNAGSGNGVKTQQSESQLDHTIPPEIKEDELYHEIQRLAREEKLTHVLEIGSSGGAGSTEAFVRGIGENANRPTLYCMEISKPRFTALSETYKHLSYVRCYNTSSVALNRFPNQQQVIEFYRSTPSILNNFPEAEILRWLQQDIDYIRSWGGDENGIQRIKRENNIENFDAVLIDGSEFLGEAELEDVYGARFLLLDDVNGYKNRRNYDRLRLSADYELIRENWQLRNGYAIFKKRAPELPIHFFTIVLNGMPFLEYHINAFKALNVPWHWHIVEGVATLNHDTAWSVSQGGHIPQQMHRNGLSNDGTSSYIDNLAKEYPSNISIYRKPAGQFWDGKREMVAAPLPHLPAQCLLWQLDNDELWTPQQIHTLHEMFAKDPSRTAAWFWCHYFVGPELAISTRNCYAQNPGQEWLRVWKFERGMEWVSHEPPVLARRNQFGQVSNVGLANPFMHADTERAGLVFQHMSYVTEAQIAFKESYYGYRGATASWNALQNQHEFPVPLKNFFPWVQDSTMVDRCERLNIDRLASKAPSGQWQFKYRAEPLSQSVTRSSVPAQTSPTHGAHGPKILIDGVFFQYRHTGIARLWLNLLREWSQTEFGKNIVVLDRNGSAPKVPGIAYRSVPEYQMGRWEYECDQLDHLYTSENADLFASTYYSRPNIGHTVQHCYDLIPEVFNFNMNEPQWQERRTAFERSENFICISNNTRQDLLRYYPTKNPHHVHMVHCGHNHEDFSPAPPADVLAFYRKAGIDCPYFLVIGPARGYKNVDLVFEGLSKLPTQHGFALVLVSGYLHDAELAAWQIGSKVIRTTLSDQELRAAYSGATALLYPSLYEGFGLPILEAMSCRCPVITTPFSSIPEVAGNAALQVQNADEFTEALAEIQKPRVRADLVQRGLLNTTRFSWKKSAQETANIFLAVAQSHNNSLISTAPAAAEFTNAGLSAKQPLVTDVASVIL